MPGLRPRLTFANVTSSVALFVALGGTSYAAIVVTGKDVRNGSLTGADVKDRSLKAKDLDRALLSQGNTLGPDGPAGPVGPKGPSGADGKAGVNGADGRAGFQGPAGSPGASGAQGPKGDQGAKGNDGTSGVPGERGATGPTGAAGPTFARMSTSDTPPESPTVIGKSFNLTTPVAGRLLITVKNVAASYSCLFQQNVPQFCSGKVGIYIDGSPVTGDSVLYLFGQGGQGQYTKTDALLSGITPNLAAGAHIVSVAAKPNPQDDSAGTGVMTGLTVDGGNISTVLIGG